MKYTLEARAVALESPVSCSRLSARALPDLVNEFSAELKDDSMSITETLFTGEGETGLNV